MRARTQRAHHRVTELQDALRQIDDHLDKGRTYRSEGAFRAALNARIRELARHPDTPDSADLARRFALQQFVSRLFDHDPAAFLVTGGTALQYRSSEARPTADIDLASTRNTTDLTRALTNASQRRGGEHGEFSVTIKPADGPGSFTGKVTYLLGGARFAVAKIDVTIGRRFPFEADAIIPKSVVAIDDLRPMPHVRTYPVSAHLADKITAMYELHGNTGTTPSSRSHDLADIVLLSRCSSVDAEELRTAVRGQEQRRALTVPAPLILPSPQWRASYPTHVAKAGLPPELREADAALATANKFLYPVLSGQITRGTWDPHSRRWITN